MKAKTTAITDKKKHKNNNSSVDDERPQKKVLFPAFFSPRPTTLETFSTFGFDFLLAALRCFFCSCCCGVARCQQSFRNCFCICGARTPTPTHTHTHVHSESRWGAWPRPKCVLWCIKKFLERSPLPPLLAACQTFAISPWRQGPAWFLPRPLPPASHPSSCPTLPINILYAIMIILPLCICGNLWGATVCKLSHQI